MSFTGVATPIEEPALLIRINQMYFPGISAQALYEATRGVWVIGERREKARYAFTVAGGIIREVFEIQSWHSAASTPYQTRPLHDVSYKGRWEFLGELAPETMRKRYIDRSVADYFPQGAANPIMYINVPR
ncbi:hypothetical protein [Trichloromonas sp.]|uniref:hypothetical protein n=1 Tax=Trichloromonas sp. TaxID=3069249 RepID=UPI003D81AABC